MSLLIINPEKEKLLRMPEHRQQQLLHLQKPRKEDLPTEEAIDNAHSFDPKSNQGRCLI